MKNGARVHNLKNDSGYRPALGKRLAEIRRACVECPKCTAECAFLARYGTPKSIVESGNPADPEFLKLAYECSLCGLCGAVCPVKLAPDALFLEMRRAAVENGLPLDRHAPILAYEKRGTSRRFTWYSLPENCDTVFFPGCTLPGTRPEKTLALYDHLKAVIPGIGIVLDCCGKPSRDLGRSEWFADMLEEMKTFLCHHRITRVITACPNCYRVFRDHGAPLAVTTVYEMLARHGLPPVLADVDTVVTVHDPCVLRREDPVHEAVRDAARKSGFRIEEMDHHRDKTLCCGEGGAVACVDAGLAGSWRTRRQSEAGGRPMLTYCAGCANALKGKSPVFHVIDAVFDPASVAAGKTGAARAPMTYLNRLRVKRRLKAGENAAVTRERQYRSPAEPPVRRNFMKWAVVVLVALLAAGLLSV